jgi:lipoprotein-releasing system permease protein
VSVLPSKIIEGSFDLNGHSVIVGSDFADAMKLSVGDRLAVSSPNDLKKMRENYGKRNEEAILPNDYTVTGIFNLGYYDFDANVIAVSLENAQDLYNLDDGVHGLMVMLRDPYQAAAVQAELQRSLGENYQTSCFICSFSSCWSPRFAS